MKHTDHIIALTGSCHADRSALLRNLSTPFLPGFKWAGRSMSLIKTGYHYSGKSYHIAELSLDFSNTAPENDNKKDNDRLGSIKPDVIAVISRGTELKKGLFHLKHLLNLEKVRETPIPLVLCIDMKNQWKQEPAEIDFEMLEDVLGFPVAAFCESRQEMLDDVKAAIHYAVNPTHRRKFLYSCLDFSPGQLACHCQLKTGFEN